MPVEKLTRSCSKVVERAQEKIIVARSTVFLFSEGDSLASPRRLSNCCWWMKIELLGLAAG